MKRPVDLQQRIEASKKLLARRRSSQGEKPERSLLALSDLTKEQVMAIIDGGISIKNNPTKYGDLLKNKSVALVFQKTSTRTRCSFEIGIGEMGGQSLYLDWNTSNFTIASLEDEIKALSRYVDAIVARVNKHEDLLVMKEHSEVPIINGLSNLYHPCQALADLMTIKEYFGELEGLNICYLGDGNDVCHSLINGAGYTGINISIACPNNYQPNAKIVAEVQRKSNIRIRIGSNPIELVKDADLIYTDTWIPMAILTSKDNSNEKDLRIKTFSDYQVNRHLQEWLRHSWSSFRMSPMRSPTSGW